ncbi:MAG: DUF4184 family protein [Verrucomicrobiota bacterium]
MPFTISHAAAVIPLARRGLVFSALVVGSMTPDVVYFTTFSPGSTFSHSIPGVFFYCVPAGLIMLWIFHFVVKRPMASLLPASHQRRLVPWMDRFSFGPPRHFLLIVLSLIIGGFTHIIWDSFTHPDGWVVEHLPALSFTVWKTSLGPVRFYRVMQHCSTLFGGAVLFGCYWRWWLRAPIHPVESIVRVSWKIKASIVTVWLASAGFVAGLYALLSRFPEVLSVGAFRVFVHRSVVDVILVVLVEIILFCLFWHLAEKRKCRLANRAASPAG